jgi:hypothetical protein
VPTSRLVANFVTSCTPRAEKYAMSFILCNTVLVLLLRGCDNVVLCSKRSINYKSYNKLPWNIFVPNVNGTKSWALQDAP